MSEQNIDQLLDYCLEFGIAVMRVEANMGHGTVSKLILQQIEKRRGKDPMHQAISVEDYYAKGQKERRIIDTVGPVMRRHKLVVHHRAIEDDWYWCQKHPRDKQLIMSAFYQLQNITYDRGSLTKDDRADAIQGLVMHLSELLVVDDEKQQQKRLDEKERSFIANPMEYRKERSTARGVMARVQRLRH